MDKRARGVRAEAAKVLQRAFRSFAEVRRHQVRFETEQRKATLARKVMEELLDEYLVDEFIPDLLIEVIVNDFQSLPPEERALHGSADAIVTEVVRVLAKKAAEGAVADFITSFLRRWKPRDTLQLLSDDVAHETVEALARDAVETAILECTCAYLLDRRVDKAWDEISTETVSALVVEVADRVYEDETAAEWSVQQLMAEVLADLFEPIATQAWLELEHQKIRVMAIVTWHAVVDRAMAQVLDHMYVVGQSKMLRGTIVLQG